LCLVNEDDVQAAIRWLKISREPWTDVLKNWDITYDIRQKTLLDPKGGGDKPLSVTDYFSQWEVLSLPQGYTLVCGSFHFVILKFIYLNADTKYIKYFNVINLC